MSRVPFVSGPVDGVAVGNGRLAVGGAAVANAAIAVGVHPAWAPSPLRAGSAFDARWRLELARAVLDWSGSRVRKRPIYDQELDRTEKGFASYHVGMVFALLWARQVLHVPHLAHVDRLLDAAGIHTNDRRPDLIGCGSGGRLYAIEAKGRSRGAGDAMVRARRQLRESRYWFALADGTPAVGVACVTYFDGDDLRVQTADPVSQARRYTTAPEIIRAASLEPYAEAILREGPATEIEGLDGYLGNQIGDTGVVVALAPEVQPALGLPEVRRQQPVTRQVLTKAALVAQDGADAQPRALPDAERYEPLMAAPEFAEERFEIGESKGLRLPNGAAVLVDARWQHG